LSSGHFRSGSHGATGFGGSPFSVRHTQGHLRDNRGTDLGGGQFCQFGIFAQCVFRSYSGGAFSGIRILRQSVFRMYAALSRGSPKDKLSFREGNFPQFGIYSSPFRLSSGLSWGSPNAVGAFKDPLLITRSPRNE